MKDILSLNGSREQDREEVGAYNVVERQYIPTLTLLYKVHGEGRPDVH